MYVTADIQTVNSLTYADVAGLQLGLPRLPGEATPVYVERLYRAAVSRRDHSYEGLLDGLVLEFGLQQVVAGHIHGDVPVAIAPGRITLGAAVVPTVVLEDDTYLVWRTLGEVFADINRLSGFTAELTADATLPALQLARQGNVFTAINEVVESEEHTLAHAGAIRDSLRFNQTITGWQLTDNALALSGVPGGLTVSYQYLANPFDVVISEVGLLNLADPSLARVAVNEHNVLAYQIREFIQAVMKADRSYWTK